MDADKQAKPMEPSRQSGGATMRNNFEQAVDWFAGTMKEKLGTRRNRRKPHWTTSTFAYLLDRLRDEVQELENEMGGASTANAISECCDVANFAMMIADKLHKLDEDEGGDDDEA